MLSSLNNIKVKNNPVDIVVTYVDSSIDKWKEQYQYYKKVEIDTGLQKENYMMAFHPGKYRSWDIFNYWFRSTEKNCPWLNKIFLIVQDSTQLPQWLNIDNPKLRIVYHEDYIPKAFLPTFNGLMISFLASLIPDLSENFIYCDDDYYFLNSISEDWFFENNKACMADTWWKYPGLDNNYTEWNEIMDTNFKFFGNDVAKKIGVENAVLIPPHLQLARKKSSELDFLNKYWDKVINSYPSKFRTKDSLTDNVLRDYLFLTDNYLNKDIYINSLYWETKDILDLKYDDNIKLFCLNDVECVNNDFDLTKKIVKLFFNTLFPNKSTFEK